MFRTGKERCSSFSLARASAPVEPYNGCRHGTAPCCLDVAVLTRARGACKTCKLVGFLRESEREPATETSFEVCNYSLSTNNLIRFVISKCCRRVFPACCVRSFFASFVSVWDRKKADPVRFSAASEEARAFVATGWQERKKPTQNEAHSSAETFLRGGFALRYW